MITNIQFLRAFAALSVVIYHTEFYYRGVVHTEFQGVAIFFVISGFIMTYISRNNSKKFFLKRCIRIVPIYSLLTIALFLFKFRELMPYDIFDYIYNNKHHAGLTFEMLLKSLLYVPYQNIRGDWHPIIGVGWTLNLEMYFYVTYAISLLISIKYAPAIVCISILFINTFGDWYPNSIPSFYTNYYTYYFVLGIISYYVWRALSVKIEDDSKNTFVISTSVCLIMFFFLWHLYPEITSQYWQPFIVATNYLLPLMIVLSALMLHSSNIRCTYRIVILIGNSSYALYLIHTLVIGQLRLMGYTVNSQSGLIMLILVISLSLLSSIIIHYGFEIPATRYLRDLFERKSVR